MYGIYHMTDVKRKVWVKVGTSDMLKPGEVMEVTAGHKIICLTRTEKNGYGAICNSCLHQGGPLGEGYIDDKGYVRCPWHGWEFHSKTGEGPPSWPDESVCAYNIEERERDIYVEIEKPTHPETIMDQMVETMIEWGIDTVFGIVGHSNLGLANAFKKAVDSGKLHYYGVRHEGAAAFAASGYAKLTGKPAACFAIAGPGATNLLTGLWDAKVDRVPIIALTGQIKTQVIGPGAFQEVPLLKAFEAVAIWSHLVLSPNNARELMGLAIKNAIVHRDVGHLIFPDNIQTLEANKDSAEVLIEGRVANQDIIPTPEVLEKVRQEINSAKKPVIIMGNGARKHRDTVIEFAEKLNIPIITTFKAKGAIADSHPLACGVLGRSGTLIASTIMGASDLLIVIGASFSNHTGIKPEIRTIQIDVDQMNLGKFHPVTLPVLGEIGATVQQLLKMNIQKKESRQKKVKQLWQQWQAEKTKRIAKKKADGRIGNPFIFQELAKYVPENAIISVDVGNNTYAFGAYYESHQHDLLMSGYLGSIGFALPAAMGAWAAEPQRKVIVIAGDGGFAQYAMEFTTAVKYNMNITVVLLNNSELAKITREQKYAYFHVWETSLVNPNFAEFATSCGGLGIRVEAEEELDNALQTAILHEGPSLVEIISSTDLS